MLFREVAKNYCGSFGNLPIAKDVRVFSPTTFTDSRGFLSVSYLENEMTDLGLPRFVRDLHSRSAKGVIRGLHIQLFPSMGKLMRVTRGSALLVAVDMREWSPTFLKWNGLHATEGNQLQVWAPSEFARGFCALEDNTEVQYRCSGYFNSHGDQTIRWDDPTIGVDWPIKPGILSERDRNAQSVKEYLENQ